MKSKEIGKYTYAMIGSIYKKPELFKDFKYVLLDECHLLNPKNLEGMYSSFFKAIGVRAVMGLTASPYRIVPRFYTRRKTEDKYYTAHLATIKQNSSILF